MEQKAANRSFHSKTNQTELKPQNLTQQQTLEQKGKMREKKSSKKGKESKAAPQTDLLVCFPSPARLTLYSPSRSTESIKRQYHHRHLTKSNLNKNSGQASPQSWARSNLSKSDIVEPTSPTVTCAGQIKIRSKPMPKANLGSTKNWESLMEEIEKLHKNKSVKHKHGAEIFTRCKKGLRYLYNCMGSHHGSDSSTSMTVEDDRKAQDSKACLKKSEGGGGSKDIFSKWFMVLQENKNNDLLSKDGSHDEKECGHSSVPPANALLLMRCRSTPEKKVKVKDQDENEETAKNLASALVSGMNDPLSRSRRWTRF